jgi:hypothetical protein
VNIQDLMGELSTLRPIFHSEADFQHPLAWLIHERHPDARIRLEVPAFAASRNHVDLLVVEGDSVTPIELKYWQAALDFVDEFGESFHLSNQAAQDMHRAAYAMDLMRVEELVAARPGSVEWVVAVTNDPSYWQPGRAGGGTSDAVFRLHDGRELSGQLDWRSKATYSASSGPKQAAVSKRLASAWARAEARIRSRGQSAGRSAMWRSALFPIREIRYG